MLIIVISVVLGYKKKTTSGNILFTDNEDTLEFLYVILVFVKSITTWSLFCVSQVSRQAGKQAGITRPEHEG